MRECISERGVGRDRGLVAVAVAVDVVGMQKPLSLILQLARLS